MTRYAGIIGHPVAHSLSPVFQRAAFEHSGIDATYELWDTPPSGIAARMNALRDPACLGANVTFPHKQAVVAYLDEPGETSARIGAVNTIVNREGRLLGFNTDGPGLVQALRREAHLEPGGASFLMLGAGGAARGIVFALVEAGAAAIAIHNRTVARAEQLAAAAGAGVRVAPDLCLDGYAAVINTTSVGMHGTGTEDVSACDFGSAPAGLLAVDIVYAPERTAFLRQAEARGLRTLGGLPMLIYQGALAFTHWTGVPAPVEVMFDAARAEFARRQRGA
jgi:shikimate dehydrogenase